MSIVIPLIAHHKNTCCKLVYYSWAANSNKGASANHKHAVENNRVEPPSELSVVKVSRGIKIAEREKIKIKNKVHLLPTSFSQ
jgi:hypothetical protein